MVKVGWKVEVNVTLKKAMKNENGSRGIATFFL
jgi:hypothetical protein